MHGDDVSAGLAELEGYLMSRAAHHRAAREAEAFADCLPWLGGAEREDVIRLYAARHLARTRQVLHEVTSRSQELRDEYARRYHALRRRVLATALLGSATAVGLLAIGLSRTR
ncbi:hypothetical protein ACFY7H_22440 [Streptomyces sp. NPDC012794]|uniref:hypothetical protein n=1 Tax=Streptomyces sp. NPDC012794 TaxID=3364850 RepID=UPI0036C4FE4B